MSISLSAAASLAMDLYYQDYAPRDAYFDVPDFKKHFALIYSDMIDKAFQKMRKENKAEEGFSNPEISAAWLVKEKIEVFAEDDTQFYYAQPSSCIFSFDWDDFNYALDTLTPAGNCNGGVPCRIQKITPEEAGYLDVAPVSRMVYAWLASSNRIMLTNSLPGLWVSYIPAVDESNDKCILSSAISATVIRATLELMFGAKNGNVIDESNDGNRNITQQDQSNPQLIKAQQR